MTAGLAATQPVPQQLRANEELLDAASAVAATLNNIGPGLGVVGPTNTYAHFSQGAKLCCMADDAGRVEIFSVLVLFFPFLACGYNQPFGLVFTVFEPSP